ncbi:hypothetical protein V5O48_008933 [Marasmius crinis-equi]|uniref:TECPR1-like DysF domain-containing protein n=1 Tax=Marasmius crinis-equi TaxID=585013 RepID=A0ABR3FCI3_9AGAR
MDTKGYLSSAHDTLNDATCAKPLHTPTSGSGGRHSRQNSKDLRQSRIRTSLPRPPSEYGTDSPSSSVGSPTLKGFVSNSTFNLLPQMLLSSSGVPTSPSVPASGTNGNNAGGNNPGRKRTKRYLNSKEPIVLLSNKDPLSIPIMSVNFKEFIQRVGPVFWLQDRIEEIVLWKRGWRMTCTWLSFYGLICYFPKLIFVLPHVALIAIMLSTYSYPKPKPPPVPALFTAAAAPGSSPPSTSEDNANTVKPPLPAPVAEDSVDWQANIQAIQNLMGAYAEAHTLVTPHLCHLSLATSSASASSDTIKPKPKSPYAVPLFTFLIITLLPTLFLVSSPYFPIRIIAFVAGAGPVIFLHPYILNLITTYYAQRSVSTWVFTFHIPASIRRRFTRLRLPEVIQVNQMTLRKKFKWTVQRLIDDNNLTDECWNSEIREVELWENERLDKLQAQALRTRSVSSDGASLSAPTTPTDELGHKRTVTLSRISTNATPVTAGWSKGNLKSGERAAWTRGRDGWSGVGADGSVSSNLTFALSPGWNFVGTEDWRADLEAKWAEEVGGGDENGWVYTNDSWVEPEPFPSKATVTRRRRWVRRIWYDAKSIEEKETEKAGGKK